MRRALRVSVPLVGSLALLALLAATAVAAWYPLGDGPRAWRPVGPPLAAQRLVVLGDSVAAGTACSCAAFPAILAREATRWSGRPAPLADVSSAGWTAAQLADVLGSADSTLRTTLAAATVVTVTIGANDLDATLATSHCGGPQNLDCFASSLTGLAGALHTVLTKVRSFAPGAEIVVTGYWNVFLGGAVGREEGPAYVQVSDAVTRRVNALLAEQAKVVHAAYADLYVPFRGDGDVDDTHLLASDGDHPDAAGHRLIATTIERTAGWRSSGG